MNQSHVHLLDLPNEMLFNILKKLDNVDILYSLFGINNKRLESIILEEIFCNSLNFTSSVHETTILGRFCNSILPQIHYNVKCLIVEPASMERILLATPYPNLTELRIFNFQRDGSLHYFTDDSSLRHIFKQQTSKLDLINKDNNYAIKSLKEYTKRVYAHILAYFENLEYFNVVETSNFVYPYLSICYLPSNTFSSSTFTYLCINMKTFSDCLCLLDGRLKQLTTFIVRAYYIDKDSSMVHRLNDLPNMKCFSLICHRLIKQYDNKLVSLLRRMAYLEKLTLYLRIDNQGVLMDPICIINEFSRCMSRLHSFKFYLSTDNNRNDFVRYMSSNDIKQNYLNIGYEEVSNIISTVEPATYHIFTLPFEFVNLYFISNIFPNIVFNYVTDLTVHDRDPFEHEFFLRVAKAFPLLKEFTVINIAPQSHNGKKSSDDIQSYQIVEYPHLTSLDIAKTDITYIEQFLNESITHLPCLAELFVGYEDLRIITKDFTSDAMRRNCANVKQLFMKHLFVDTQIVGSRDYYIYFPLL